MYIQWVAVKESQIYEVSVFQNWLQANLLTLRPRERGIIIIIIIILMVENKPTALFSGGRHYLYHPQLFSI